MTLTYSKLLATIVFIAGALLSYMHCDSTYFNGAVALVTLVVVGQNAGRAYVNAKNKSNYEKSNFKRNSGTDR
jgi:NhaP-type Na+/H+ or K+/H+ antiporter